MYFWATIRKNRAKYNLTRGISEEDITAILFRNVVLERDVPTAEAALLQLSGLKKYVGLLKSDREREDFRRHMRKYINIWLPDCPFEVSTSNRYTIVTHEAAITARRSIKKGETIKYLCGNKVQMTPDEEKDLDLTRRDFSVVMTSRKKTPSLFLGPARFANHDCKANAKLVPRGPEGMIVVAEREIIYGHEITVNYGEHYFGEDNCECLCATCEAGATGAWADKDDDEGEVAGTSSTPGDDSDPDTMKPRQSRGSRRKESPTNSSLTSLTSLTSFSSYNGGSDEESNPKKKRRLSVRQTPAALDIGISEDILLSPTPNTRKVGSPLRNVLHVEDIIIEPKSGQSHSYPQQPLSLKEAGQHGKTTSVEDEVLADVRTALVGGNCVGEPAPQQLEEIPSAQEDQSNTRSNSESFVPYRFSSPFSFLTGKTSSNSSGRFKQFFHRARTNSSKVKPEKQSLGTSSMSSGGDSTMDNSMPQRSSPATTLSTRFSSGIDWNTADKMGPILFSSVASSALSTAPSTLTSIAGIDDNNFTIKRKRVPVKRGRPRKVGGPCNTGQPNEAKVTKPKPALRTPRKPRVVQPTIEIDLPSRRAPGDYVRTRLLLGESHSRWVGCRTCRACWVQANGYQTRKECPRCERHSKLYGYQWPKTEKAGKNDDEERVMDHRIVHRFIPAEEEKLEMKRGRGVGIITEGAGVSEMSESTGDDFGSSERTDSRAGNGRLIRGRRPLIYTR